MSVRGELRELIRTLEDRFIPDRPEESDTLDLDIPHILKRDDLNELRKAHIERKAVYQVLDRIAQRVRDEVDALHIAQTRRHNQQRRAVDLPFEILVKVFEAACLTPESLRADSNALRQTRGAISLTCTQWRAAVLHEPVLWSTIMVSCQKTLRFPNLSLIPLEVQRAGTRLLRWSLNAFVDADRDPLGLSLKTHLGRCEWVRVYPRNGKKAETLKLFADLLDSLPNLRSLDLTIRPENDDRQTFDLTVASSLRGLNVHYRHSFQPLLLVPSSCDLTRLYLDGMIDPVSALNVINLCDRLETLCWLDHNRATPPVSLPQIVPLQRLRHLSVAGRVPATLCLRAHAPNLEYLEIRSVYNPWAEQILPALHFPKLRVVYIDTITAHGLLPAMIPPNILVPFLELHSSYLQVVHLPQCLPSEVVQCLGALHSPSGSDDPSSSTSEQFRFAELRQVYVSSRTNTLNRFPNVEMAVELVKLRSRYPAGSPPCVVYLPDYMFADANEMQRCTSSDPVGIRVGLYESVVCWDQQFSVSY